MNVVQEIDVSRCTPAPWNEPRPLTDEFMASIQRKGLLQPILLRPLGAGFQIVCGERRWRAYDMMSLKTIAAFVMEMTDAEAMDATFVENVHRADQTPLQEARMLVARANLPEFDIQILADGLGWMPSKIRRRMKLLDLSQAWTQALGDPASRFRAWSVAHFEEMALYPSEVQEKLFGSWEYSGPEKWNLKDLRAALREETYELRRAPWDLADATLCAAGACNGCMKRSSVQADLFGDSYGKKQADDRCLDRTCYREKGNAQTHRNAAALAEKHGRILHVSENHGTADAFHPGEFEIVGKKAEGARPAIWMDGLKQGAEVWVRPSIEASAKADKVEPRTPEQKWAMLKSRRQLWIAQHLMDTMAERTKIAPAMLGVPTLAAWAVAYGLEQDVEVSLPKLIKSEKALRTALWFGVVRSVTALLSSAIKLKNVEAEIEIVAHVVDASGEELKAAAENAHPTPKSLEGFKP